MATLTLTKKCACGNRLDTPEDLVCDPCAFAALEVHSFRITWSGVFCVTCNSPYCDLA